MLKIRVYMKKESQLNFSLPGPGTKILKDYFYIDYYKKIFSLGEFKDFFENDGFINIKVFNNN